MKKTDCEAGAKLLSKKKHTHTKLAKIELDFYNNNNKTKKMIMKKKEEEEMNAINNIE